MLQSHDSDARRRRWRAVILTALALVLIVGAGARIAAGREAHRYSDAHGMRIERYTLESRRLQRTLHEIAVVPSGGTSRGLLVFLHGRRDRRFSLPSWIWPQAAGPDTVLTDAFLDELAQLGSRAPVVVFLDGGEHSYYHDRHDGPWGSMILEEAIPDAVRRFDTPDGGIAIGGISMGGYGALYLASRDPGRFCAVGGHSAALWEEPGDSAPGAFDDADDFARHDVFARAAAYRRLPVWIDTGTNDWFHDADLAFAKRLRSDGVDVKVRVWPGSHERAYWDAHMRAYLQFYSRALARCTS